MDTFIDIDGYWICLASFTTLYIWSSIMKRIERNKELELYKK
jgi:hypothetical protein